MAGMARCATPLNSSAMDLDITLRDVLPRRFSHEADRTTW
jgi:hypothetical protein